MTVTRGVRWWAFVLLVALTVPIGWLVFVADGWTVNRLVVEIWSRAAALGVSATPEQTDGVLNFLMLLPSALLASLWLPRVRWWVWAAVGAVASASIEGVQHFTARDANAYDVAFNTLGASVGALAGAGLDAALSARSDVVGPGGRLRQEPGGHPEQSDEARPGPR